jgi:hypothetical protein
MQLKHLNLTTSDVSGLAAFFERFFGFKRLLERGSGAFTILSNNEDFVLTLMKAKKHDLGYPKLSMSGFTSTIQLPSTPSTMNLQQPVYLQEKSTVQTITGAVLISIAPLPATSLSRSPHHRSFNN